MTTPRRAHLVPLVLGTGALAVGVALALSSPAPPLASQPSSEPEDATTAPVPAASASGSAAPSSASSQPAPDLSGPDVGVVEVADAHDVAALAVRDRRLWWLTTTPPELKSAAIDGGEVTTLFASDAESDFGGTLVVDGHGIYWTVESGARKSEPIYFLRATATRPPAAPLEPVTLGAAPRNLVLDGGPLSWSNLGKLLTLGADGAARELADRGRRISTMARCDGDLSWIEVPYEGSEKPRLMRLVARQDEPQQVTELEPGEHDLLRCHGGVLSWTVDEPNDEHWLMQAPLSGGPSQRLLRTGPVVGLVVASGDLVWAEAHGSDSEPLVLLQRSHAGQPAQRLGRDRGPLSAMAPGPAATGAEGQWIYWAAAAGIKRLALSPAEAPAPQ